MYFVKTHSASIMSRPDYYNSVLAGLAISTVAPWQRVPDGRLVIGLRSQDHVTPAVKSMHWLPAEYRIRYKLCLLVHFIYTDQWPGHLAQFVQTVAAAQIIVWHQLPYPRHKNQTRRMLVFIHWSKWLELSS